MNNVVTNQIYPKNSQYISLDQIFYMIYETKVSLSPGLVYSLSASPRCKKRGSEVEINLKKTPRRTNTLTTM